MTAYAAFLRGINLGPSNKVAMPALRTLAEGLGYGDVGTYINSGNLVFTSRKRPGTLVMELQNALATELGLKIDVAVRTQARLESILAANPYPDGDPSRVTVAFLTGPVATDAPTRVTALQKSEEVTFGAEEVYVHYPDGIGTSKLAVQLSKALGVSSTVRNVRTVGAVLERLPRA